MPTGKASKTVKAAAKPAAKPASAPPADDDAPVVALNLPAGELSPAMSAYLKKCQDKLGFVPNVLVAYAFDNAKLEPFVAMYNDLMLGESGLSKLEREMIAVAVSAQNRCYYCLTAHGAAVRQYSGNPLLGEQMAMNYRAARLNKRQRAMLDFAVKLTAEPAEVEEADREQLRARRLLRPRHLGHRGGRRLLQHVEPRGGRHRHAAECRLSRADAVIHFPCLRGAVDANERSSTRVIPRKRESSNSHAMHVS